MTSLPPDSISTEHEIREVPIMARRKRPTGFVAHHYPCGWSTQIMVNDDESRGYDRANAALAAHLRECRLSLANRTRPPINPHPPRHRVQTQRLM